MGDRCWGFDGSDAYATPDEPIVKWLAGWRITPDGVPPMTVVLREYERVPISAVLPTADQVLLLIEETFRDYNPDLGQITFHPTIEQIERAKFLLSGVAVHAKGLIPGICLGSHTIEIVPEGGTFVALMDGETYPYDLSAKFATA